MRKQFRNLMAGAMIAIGIGCLPSVNVYADECCVNETWEDGCCVNEACEDGCCVNETWEDGCCVNEACEEEFEYTGEGITGTAAVYDGMTKEECMLGTPASVKIPVKVDYKYSMARQMFNDLNAFRTSNTWYWNEANTAKISVSGRPKLVYDYDLEQVAMQRAAECAVAYGHYRPDGKQYWDTYSELGYGFIGRMGENIAAGYRDADSVLTAWIEEDKDYAGQGHRRNILEEKYVTVGLGCVYRDGYYYWTQEFSGGDSKAEDKASDGEKIAYVYVSPAYVNSVSANMDSIAAGCKDEVSFKDIKGVFTVDFAGSYTFGRAVTCATPLSWTSNNTKVIEISDGSGVVKGPGEATLTSRLLNKNISVALKAQHKYTVTDSKESTCTKKGYAKKVCVCGYKVEEELPLAEHTIVKDKAVKATCEESGLSEGEHCSVCNAILTKQEVLPAKGHDYTGRMQQETQYNSYGQISITKRRCRYCDKVDTQVEAQNYAFSDISTNKWYHNAVVYAGVKGIMSGVGDNNFNPDGKCTREMMVTIIHNMSFKPGATVYNIFTDNIPGKWYYEPILWAYQTGITSGISSDRFGVGQNVTREQMACFLYNYASYCGYDLSNRKDISSYADVKQVSSWAYDKLEWANANGIINGSVSGGVKYLNPKGNASRAEVAQMMMNFKNTFSW